ncbi:hypothetical protein [Paraburkholderia youngii]|uniref:hypothetical protein n=1 Tax=Paraburkholderia youngii TaxID=2782701 RepID=UPI003D1B934B
MQENRSFDHYVPVRLLAGSASALRMPGGSMLNAVKEAAACAAERRKSRRFVEVMVVAQIFGGGKRHGEDELRY